MAKFGIGQAVRRVEDQRFLLGQGRYVDDINLPGQAYGVTVLSPHAHARIKRDRRVEGQGRARRALRADRRRRRGRQARRLHRAPDAGGFRRARRATAPSSRVLVADKVRFVGDRVAFVVAETLDAGARRRRAGRGRLRAAAGGGRSRGRRQGRRAEGLGRQPDTATSAFRLMFGNKEATDAAFAKAKHVVKLRVENNRLSPIAMEPRVAHRRLQRGRRSLHALHRLAESARRAHGDVAHLPRAGEPDPRRSRPTSAAASASRAAPFPDDALVLWASRKLRRPVKWVATRIGEHADRSSRPRDGLLRRARARRAAARFSALRAQVPVPARRLFRRRGAGGRRLLGPLHAGGLRHPDHAHHVAGPVHQHLADAGPIAAPAVPRRPISRSG